jgi:phosphoenolpyruvate carboxykinase (ATP)
MALHPTVYADMFGKLVTTHDVDCWLVNTGWTGGPYGTGHRMEIAVSRAVIQGVLSGALADVSRTVDPVFGLAVPVHCPGVADGVLQPRTNWADPAAYDVAARDLAARFIANFKRYAERARPEVLAASPRL